MLWMKQTFDPDHYDREFAQIFSVGRLPEPEPPPPEIVAEFLTRQKYPASLRLESP